MKCVECGNFVDSNFNFCPKCGFKTNPDKFRSCKSNECPQCTEKLVLNANFCPKCGFILKVNPASKYKRLLAFIIDLLIIQLSFDLMTNCPVNLILWNSQNIFSEHFWICYLNHSFFYYVPLEMFYSYGSIGKGMLGIKPVPLKTSRLNFKTSILRHLGRYIVIMVSVFLLSILPLIISRNLDIFYPGWYGSLIGLGLLSILYLILKPKSFVHDRISGTAVIEVKPKSFTIRKYSISEQN